MQDTMQETAQETSYYFADHTGAAEKKVDLIPAVTIPKEAIDAEIERLASLPAPANPKLRLTHPLVRSFLLRGTHDARVRK